MVRSIDWDDIELVVFDVDGTLYDQRKLRMRMAFELAKSFDLAAAVTIFVYRRTREKLGDERDPAFLDRQFEAVAARLRIPVARVRRTVAEWIEERPLLHMSRAVVPGTSNFFSSLRSAGRRIAVFSDYPAQEKLAALGLSADVVVSSTDPDVARLKPDPAGLNKILDRTGVSPHRALMIGDRVERDGIAATLAGVRFLHRTSALPSSFPTFRTFEDEMFAPVLQPDVPTPLAWTSI